MKFEDLAPEQYFEYLRTGNGLMYGWDLIPLDRTTGLATVDNGFAFEVTKESLGVYPYTMYLVRKVEVKHWFKEPTYKWVRTKHKEYFEHPEDRVPKSKKLWANYLKALANSKKNITGIYESKLDTA